MHVSFNTARGMQRYNIIICTFTVELLNIVEVFTALVIHCCEFALHLLTSVTKANTIVSLWLIDWRQRMESRVVFITNCCLNVLCCGHKYLFQFTCLKP